MEILNNVSSSQAFLNYSLAIGFLILVIAIALFLHRLSKTLSQVDDLLIEAEEIMQEAKENIQQISAIRNTIKSGAMGVFSSLVSLLTKSTNNKS